MQKFEANIVMFFVEVNLEDDSGLDFLEHYLY